MMVLSICLRVEISLDDFHVSASSLIVCCVNTGILITRVFHSRTISQQGNLEGTGPKLGESEWIVVIVQFSGSLLLQWPS